MKSIHALFLLPAIPTLTELLETGFFQLTPETILTDLILTGIITLLVCNIYRNHLLLRQLSERDELTGLYNARKFNEDLVLEIARSRRMETRLVLAYIDIDQFKSINDQYGHQTGDKVLKSIACNLESVLRKNIDRCYRVGGDEFAVLLPGVKGKNNNGIIDRIKNIGCLGTGILNGQNIQLSIGISKLENEDSAETFLNRADRFMYMNKKIKWRETEYTPGYTNLKIYTAARRELN